MVEKFIPGKKYRSLTDFFDWRNKGDIKLALEKSTENTIFYVSNYGNKIKESESKQAWEEVIEAKEYNYLIKII